MGYSEQELLNRTFQDITHPDDLQSDMDFVERLLTGEIDHYQMEKRYFHKDGHTVWIHLSVSLIRDAQNNPIHFVAQIEDITERKKSEEQIRNLAFFDPLTSLPNRRLLNDRLQQSLAANKRSGRYAALMFLDLDNFKSLNDTHGHDVGDLLLIEVAHRISHCVREVDSIARLGGDEFVVIISELDVNRDESISRASIVAEKIHTALAEPYVLAVHQNGKKTTVEHRCTSSIGVVMFINHEISTEEIQKRADIAMGRNRVCFYE